MKFEPLLGIVGNQPVFETGLLLAGEVDLNDFRRQLSRWVQSGRSYNEGNLVVVIGIGLGNQELLSDLALRFNKPDSY